MNKSNECRRYKWSISATNLLVSVWCHDLVQNQLKVSTRNQPIWESIARYMSRKGFPVTGLQCRTRIKNMLCNYHDAVRKKDVAGIEPYYDIFKKVLTIKSTKKKVVKAARVKQSRFSEEKNDENEVSLDPNSCGGGQNFAQNMTNAEYQMEFLDLSNRDSLASCLNSSETLKEVEKLIIQATDAQTKTIVKVIEAQSQMIKKFLKDERERLETILVSESESRRKLETRLDLLLSRFETNCIPQVTYIGTAIESKHNE